MLHYIIIIVSAVMRLLILFKTSHRMMVLWLIIIKFFDNKFSFNLSKFPSNNILKCSFLLLFLGIYAPVARDMPEAALCSKCTSTGTPIVALITVDWTMLLGIAPRGGGGG